MRLASLASAVVVCAALVGQARAQVTEPVAGLWHFSGRVNATGCADRCVSQRQTIDEDVVVTDAGVSGGEALLGACDGASAADFANVVTLAPTRRGWLRIKIARRRDLVRLLRRCTGYPSLRLGSFSGRIRIAPDGLSVDEVVHLSGSVSVSGRTATFSANGRVHAARVGDVPAGRPLAAGRFPLLPAGIP